MLYSIGGSWIKCEQEAVSVGAKVVYLSDEADGRAAGVGGNRTRNGR
jgi:hypothetical protein